MWYVGLDTQRLPLDGVGAFVARTACERWAYLPCEALFRWGIQWQKCPS